MGSEDPYTWMAWLCLGTSTASYPGCNPMRCFSFVLSFPLATFLSSSNFVCIPIHHSEPLLQKSRRNMAENNRNGYSLPRADGEVCASIHSHLNRPELNWILSGR